MSSETPDNATAKTVWAPKSQRRLLVLLGVGAILCVVAGWVVWQRSRAESFTMNGRTIRLERVDEQAERQKGLSDRDSLGKDRGMLFVFARDQATCFWMKDMRFPLDIIWLDVGKQVVQVAAHVSPLTYPRTFCPPDPATYVIELNAGQADKLGITPGRTIVF